MIAALVFLAFNAQSLPLIGGGTVYQRRSSPRRPACKPDDPVRVAGVKVGKVESLALEDGAVTVEFRVVRRLRRRPLRGGHQDRDGARAPSTWRSCRAAARELDPDKPIPVDRTASPYDVVEAFADLSTTVEQIDTTQLADSFEVLSQTFADTPDEVRTSLQGLARLSDTISSRDAQLRQLLSATRKVSQVLADRNGEFTQLIVDSNTLLTEVQRAARADRLDPHQHPGAVAAAVRAWWPTTARRSRRRCSSCRTVTDILSRNRAALAQTINNLAPFVRVFTNTLGNGRWFDSFVDNLLPGRRRRRRLRRRRHDAAARGLLGGQLMSGSLQRGVAVAAAVVLLAALGWTILRPAGQYRVTAWFDADRRPLSRAPTSASSASPSASVTDVVPEGDRVRVEMLIDDDYDIPADADAVVLAPSLVSDRYVQFAPVYDGGATMKDGAKVPLERTATPVELDQVYGALDELSAALGPNGANKNGALSDLVDVGAANLDGNGAALNRTLTGFSQAVETLAEHRDDLFSSLDNLQTFTSPRWPRIDAQVGQFNDNMAAVADLLAQERQDLASAVQLLNKALADVAGFVQRQHHAADHERQPARRRDARPGAAAAGPRRGARRRAGRAGQPRARLQPRLRHPRHPRQLASGSTDAEVIVCQILAATGRVTIDDLPVPTSRRLPQPLPTTPEGICARLLSGDADADERPGRRSTATACPTCRSCSGAAAAAAAPAPAARHAAGLPAIPGSQ